jgi:hypothetical protein
MTWADQYPDTPEPKFYTRRDLSRKTHGWRVAQIAEALGKPLMPWQRYVVDVALEYDEAGYYYEDVLVTVPRQSGKTTLVGPVQLDRIIFQKNVNIFYTAQTQKDARKRFDDLVTLVKGSPFAAVATIRLSAGSEHIRFPSGSKLNLFAPNKDAIHGETPPLVTLDEIWALDEELGDAIYDDAIKPAQFTLAGNRQRWQISTAGTALSTYMRKHVKRGRKGAARMAYFEWSLRDGDDPYDPESISRFHPAVGHTATVADVFALAGRDENGNIKADVDPDEVMSHAKYLRSLCNIWTEAAEAIIPAEDWEKLAAQPLAVPSVRDITIAYEVAPGNTSASVMAVWRDLDGKWCIRTLHTAPGVIWLAPFVRKLAADWRPAAITADDGGNTRRVTDDLVRGDPEKGIVPVDVTLVKGRDFATACDVFLTAAMDERDIRHDKSKTLSTGIAHLALLKRGDSRYFSRDRSTGSIAGPLAAAVGMWTHDHRDAPMPAPFIYA